MKQWLSIAGLVALTLQAHAETQLRPIITSSRVAQTADQTLTAVTVINRADINNTQSQSLPEVLQQFVPGLDFSTTGGVGHQVSTFLRGTSSDNVLVLIDGNIIGSATTGASALELIPLQQIERIEVVRGPRSALYGSDAIGGVIQIFTRQQQAGDAALTLGSFNTLAAEASLGLGSEEHRYSLGVNLYQTDGFDVTNDGEADDDGYTNQSINLGTQHRLDEHNSLRLRWLHALGETEFDNQSFDNVSDSLQQSLALALDSALSADWSSQLEIGQTRDRLETSRNSEDFFSPGVFNFERTLFETRREQARWLHRYNFSDTGLVSAGLDYLNDEVISTTSYASNERRNSGAYLLVQDKFGAHQLQLSGRVDDNQSFGIYRSSGAAWSWDASSTLRTSLSRSTAFIAPTFNDLYFVDAFFVGNPDLDPETASTVEAALIGSPAWGSWELRVYHTEFDNLIINVSSNPADPFAPFTTRNARRAEIDGVEVAVAMVIDGWDSRLSLARIDAVDLDTGLLLQNRAESSLQFHSWKYVRGHRLVFDLLAQGERYADSANTRLLPGYGIVNFALERALGARMAVKLKLQNLLDKDYSTSTDFFGNTTNNTPRALFLTLSYQG